MRPNGYIYNFQRGVKTIGSCKSRSFLNNCMAYVSNTFDTFSSIFIRKFKQYCWVLLITVSSIIGYFSETFLLSCVLQVRLCFAEYTIKLNILVHFLVLDTNWKSLPYKFLKHVNDQEVQIKEKDEGQLLPPRFLFSTQTHMVVTFLPIRC